MSILDRDRVSVKDLMKYLRTCPPDAEVQVWLPGSYIRLMNQHLLPKPGEHIVLIEGNMEPGSALERDW